MLDSVILNFVKWAATIKTRFGVYPSQMQKMQLIGWNFQTNLFCLLSDLETCQWNYTEAVMSYTWTRLETITRSLDLTSLEDYSGICILRIIGFISRLKSSRSLCINSKRLLSVGEFESEINENVKRKRRSNTRTCYLELLCLLKIFSTKRFNIHSFLLFITLPGDVMSETKMCREEMLRPKIYDLCHSMKFDVFVFLADYKDLR